MNEGKWKQEGAELEITISQPASVLEVYLKEGKREFPLDEIRALVPEACLYCPDMTAEFAVASDVCARLTGGAK